MEYQLAIQLKRGPAPESVVPRPCALATECRRPARLRELKHLYIDVYVIFKLYKIKKRKEKERK